MMHELVEVPSFFGKMRGKLYIFLAFLIGQVGLGLGINFLSEKLF